jgi:hypothetical protein
LPVAVHSCPLPAFATDQIMPATVSKNVRSRLVRAARRADHQPVAKRLPVPAADPPPSSLQLKLFACAALLLAGLWSYWPTLASLAGNWLRVADYSHGFLVAPLAVAMLWVRRDKYPGLGATSPMLALAFFLVAILLRHAGDAFFFAFLDGWSIVPWVAAVAALAGGRPLLAWSWPAIMLLVFMVTLPYSLEH